MRLWVGAMVGVALFLMGAPELVRAEEREPLLVCAPCSRAFFPEAESSMAKILEMAYFRAPWRRALPGAWRLTPSEGVPYLPPDGSGHGAGSGGGERGCDAARF